VGCQTQKNIELKAVSTPKEAVQRLIEGNERWIKSEMSHPNQTLTQRETVAKKGQKPFATIVTCSDSRVSPEFIFDQGVGDIFIIRVAGNVLDVTGMASVEYGIDHLHTPLLLILGHTQCGAVTAACEEKKDDHGDHGSIPMLLEKISPVVQKTKAENEKLSGKDFIEATAKNNVLSVIENLPKSPVVNQLLQEKKIEIIGAIYNLESGKMEIIYPR
jgi:carbonic anhydrase